MKKTTLDLPEKKIIGITCRTNNKNAFEADPATNPIAQAVQHYFQTALMTRIPNRTTPGVTYCIYTNYEHDHTGDYTYIIGEEVSSFDALPDGFSSHTIPAQRYVKFTNEPGPMPKVCVDMWHSIWAMTPQDLGSARAYQADFEVYDDRSHDHSHVVLDIYIGICMG